MVEPPPGIFARNEDAKRAANSVRVPELRVSGAHNEGGGSAAVVGIKFKAMKFQIDIEREEDERFIAEIAALSGVLVYGVTEEEAVTRVEALALRVVADKLEHGE